MLKLNIKLSRYNHNIYLMLSNPKLMLFSFFFLATFLAIGSYSVQRLSGRAGSSGVSIQEPIHIPKHMRGTPFSWQQESAPAEALAVSMVITNKMKAIFAPYIL